MSPIFNVNNRQCASVLYYLYYNILSFIYTEDNVADVFCICGNISTNIRWCSEMSLGLIIHFLLWTLRRVLKLYGMKYNSRKGSTLKVKRWVLTHPVSFWPINNVRVHYEFWFFILCLMRLMHLSMLSPRVGGGGYLWEIDSENLSLGRDFDTYSMCFPGSGIWHARHLGTPREPGDELSTIIVFTWLLSGIPDFSRHHGVKERKANLSCLFVNMDHHFFLSLLECSEVQECIYFFVIAFCIHVLNIRIHEFSTLSLCILDWFQSL